MSINKNIILHDLIISHCKPSYTSCCDIEDMVTVSVSDIILTSNFHLYQKNLLKGNTISLINLSMNSSFNSLSKHKAWITKAIHKEDIKTFQWNVRIYKHQMYLQGLYVRTYVHTDNHRTSFYLLGIAHPDTITSNHNLVIVYEHFKEVYRQMVHRYLTLCFHCKSRLSNWIQSHSPLTYYSPDQFP